MLGAALVGAAVVGGTDGAPVVGLEDVGATVVVVCAVGAPVVGLEDVGAKVVVV